MNKCDLYEEPRLIKQEELNPGIYKLVFCEWRDGREELVAIDDRSDPPTCLQNYNKKWRLWTNLPTKEQRENEPWDLEV